MQKLRNVKYPKIMQKHNINPKQMLIDDFREGIKHIVNAGKKDNYYTKGSFNEITSVVNKTSTFSIGEINIVETQRQVKKSNLFPNALPKISNVKL